MKVLIAAGGTGGHILPGLKFGQLCQKYFNAEVFFVCEKGNKFVKLISQFFPVRELRQARFSGQNVFKKIRALWVALYSINRALALLKREKPDFVLGAGGFASFSIVFAAKLRGIPAFIHEQNVLPGRANLFLARLVDAVLLSFEESRRYFRVPENKVFHIGNPVYKRENFQRKLSDWPPHRILIFGGSQGARLLNEIVAQMFEQGLSSTTKHQFTLITGHKHYEHFKERLREYKNVRVLDFCEDMPRMYMEHNLVVSRAGATTIAELCRFKIPAILVPFPYAYKRHQDYNAYFLKKRGAAEMILEEELTPEKLNLAIENTLVSEVYNTRVSAIDKVFDFEPRERFVEFLRNFLKERDNV